MSQLNKKVAAKRDIKKVVAKQDIEILREDNTFAVFRKGNTYCYKTKDDFVILLDENKTGLVITKEEFAENFLGFRTKNHVQSEFNKGAAHVRDNILCLLIGLQEEIGHNNEDKPEYQALQNAYNTIVEHYGDMFQDYKG